MLNLLSGAIDPQRRAGSGDASWNWKTSSFRKSWARRCSACRRRATRTRSRSRSTSPARASGTCGSGTSSRRRCGRRAIGWSWRSQAKKAEGDDGRKPKREGGRDPGLGDRREPDGQRLERSAAVAGERAADQLHPGPVSAAVRPAAGGAAQAVCEPEPQTYEGGMDEAKEVGAVCRGRGRRAAAAMPRRPRPAQQEALAVMRREASRSGRAAGAGCRATAAERGQADRCHRFDRFRRVGAPRRGSCSSTPSARSPCPASGRR